MNSLSIPNFAAAFSSSLNNVKPNILKPRIKLVSLIAIQKKILTCIFSLSKLARELIEVIELAGELFVESSSPGGLSILCGLVTDFLLAFRKGILKNRKINKQKIFSILTTSESMNLGLLLVNSSYTIILLIHLQTLYQLE